ncbi:MAG: acetate uptake transporter [Campylobacteraceae bacterium]|jgi:succinate-acetate transporter protein|nr:acetate uptake transporter [Campylobacteraceae bacterium]
MENDIKVVEIASKQPDPSALGLFGLAMVTLVASSEKLGLSVGTIGILPCALILGGFIQLIAGVLDYKKQNVFGGLAFMGYGMFWVTIALTWWFMFQGYEGDFTTQLGFLYLGYLIFTIYMTIGASTTNGVLFAIFVAIDVLFIALTCYGFGISPAVAKVVAGIAELLIALLSFYGSAANVLNIHMKREILPIGKMCSESDEKLPLAPTIQ